MDEDEESGHGPVQVGRDLGTDGPREERSGEGLVLDHGHVVLSRDLLDSFGHEPLAFGHDLGRSHRQRVVLEGHGQSRWVGHDHVGRGHGIHHSGERHLAGPATAGTPDQRIAFGFAVLLLDLFLCHSYGLHRLAALNDEVDQGHDRQQDRDREPELEDRRQAAAGDDRGAGALSAHDRLDAAADHLP